MGEMPTAHHSAPHKERLLWLVAIGFFMQSLDATILNTALPAMATELGESPMKMQSVIVAYALTTAMLIPATGWVADRFGTRRVYGWAIGLFVLGSVLCALSPSLPFLIAARVVQGVGGAMMLPVGRLAVLRTYPRGEFIRAMSFIAIPGQVGPLLGPTLGGWMVEYASWHWIFWINVPVGLIGLWATWRWFPRSAPVPVHRFDGKGYAMLAFGMVAISIALDGLSGMGLGMALVVVLMVFGLASLASYWMHALRVDEPLFAPGLFKVRSLRVGLLGNLFTRFGSGAAPFLIPLMLQVGLKMSPMNAGLMMLATVTGSMLVKRIAVRTVQRFGYKRVLQVNSVMLAVMLASFGLVVPGTPVWLLLVQLFIFGGFNSMQFSAMNSVTLKDMEGESASSGNSLLSMVQMLAMSMGVALAGALLTGFSDMWPAHSDERMQAIRATFVTVALMTLAATLVFSQLDADEPVRPAPDGGDA
ncbi:major facilitator transporter [Comamonas thiooxydans]|uniref:Major facilitator transporter n=2 Tax=Comamonas thiooxydans TaxID=363952 RepID=A0A0E3BV36_9BURK|nr:major facilitator transporter [Comamonas thiooxydans]KGH19781.1 major facilitator transporter [Comamonas thiooxydans]KGH23460.1 major facilitator transporter [Comamonas thiooxydans]MCO8247733.1 multidrug transporter subunit MdtD [Comamonas thiooxydans]OAD85142.1 EmrB/QacA subfamily drug resistance transporter [Comamonas thiooxydans]